MIALLLIFSAHALDLKKITGDVTFAANVRPGSFKIRGQGGAPSCLVKNTADLLGGECTFDLTTLDTSNQTRNGHMRDKYLETDKYPKAKLTFDKVALPQGDQPLEAPFAGQLELHGVTKPVAGTLRIRPAAKSVTADVTFEVKLSDHAITQPSFAGIKVDDLIAVSIHTSTPNE